MQQYNTVLFGDSSVYWVYVDKVLMQILDGNDW